MKPIANSEYSPLVSIALTTFNGGDLLRQQLDSILLQTYRNYEVIMSDDGSGPETVAILNEYCSKDKRFKWSRSPLERGYRKNTENAVRLCSGEIIILCDQDDVWFSNKIQSHVDAYRDPSVMWAFNRFVFTDSEGNETGYIEDVIPDYYRHKTILENVWGTCIGAAQTSYRADVIKKALPIPEYCPAHDSWIQLAIYPAKPFFIDKVVNTYRQHNSNQIGMKSEVNLEESKKREKIAIADNYYRLRKYASEKHLQLWKRIFLIFVYYLKCIRLTIRKLFGRGDERLS